MKALFGCCLAIVITIAVVIGLIVGGVMYISNMTLGELGLSDTVLVNNMTVDQLGLTDVKLKDVYDLLTSIVGGVDEAEIVTNPFTTEDTENLKDKLEGSNIIDPVTGEINFDNIHGGYVIFDSANPITFLDTELAAFFNLIIAEGFNNEEDNQEEIADGEEGTNEDVKISICEVTLTVDGANGASMRTVLKFDITTLRDQMMAQVPAPMQSYVNLGDALYIVTESDITADSEGKVQAGETHVVTINNIPAALTDPFMLLLVNAIIADNQDGIEGIDGEPIEAGPGFFAEMMCGLFAQFIYRIGIVGSDAAHLGNSGFLAVTATTGSITIVPWTLATVPVDEEYMDEVYSDVNKAEASKIFNYAKLIESRVNNGEIVLLSNDPANFITYLNNNQAPCVLGTTYIADQTVVDVVYNGTDFTVNAVYTSIGSYTCLYQSVGNFNLLKIEGYDYDTDLTIDELDLLAATAQAEEAYYLTAVVAFGIHSGDIVIADTEVSTFISTLNSTYNLNVASGSAAPTSEGTVLNISYQSGWFAYGFASTYVKYGTATYTYTLFNP